MTKGTGSHDLECEPVEAVSDEKGLDKDLRVSVEESMGAKRLAWARQATPDEEGLADRKVSDASSGGRLRRACMMSVVVRTTGRSVAVKALNSRCSTGKQVRREAPLSGGLRVRSQLRSWTVLQSLHKVKRCSEH